MKFVIIFLLVLLIFFSNLIHLWMKWILRQKGYQVNLFWGHLRDVHYFSDLIAGEKNLRVKREYQRVLYGFYLLIASIVILALLLFSYV